jgi:hypothetical protein
MALRTACNEVWQMLKRTGGARESLQDYLTRLFLIGLITLSLASTIIAAKTGPPEDVGCGLDYSGLPIPCQPF